MDIYNIGPGVVEFCIYEAGDRLYWFSVFPGGTGRFGLGPGAHATWPGAGARAQVQIVFFVNGTRLGPKLVSPTAVTIDAARNVVNSAPRPAVPKDLIHHIVVLMLENRSFDNVLGWLYADTANQPPRNIPALPVPTYDGLSANAQWNTLPASAHDAPGAQRFFATRGVSAAPWYQQPNPNPREDYPSMLEQVFGTETPGAGARADMSGFVASYAKADPADPGRVMQCFSPEQLPILNKLARSYAVCDRWFGSLPCETLANRSFLHAGTSFGRLNNGDQLYEDNDPLPNFPFYGGRRTVFDALDDSHVSWRAYHDSLLAPSLTSTQFWTVWQKLTHAASPFAEFERAARAGSLPAYSFVEPEYIVGANDQHPGAGCDMRRGEELLLRTYNALSQGPAWNNTLLIILYDEHGGCYDHIPPPATAVPPDGSAPQFSVLGFAPFRQFGPRVPAVLVSPLIEAGTVFRAPPGRNEYDHTSVLATLREWLFRPENGVPAVPATWLSSARAAAAPSVWPVLTRTVPRTDRPALAMPPSPRAALDLRVDSTPPDDALLSPIQRGLAIEADALQHAGDLARPGEASALDEARWQQLVEDAKACRRPVAPLPREQLS